MRRALQNILRPNLDGSPRKTRNDKGKPNPKRGNRQAKGRPRKHSVLLKPFAIPEPVVRFLEYERQRRGYGGEDDLRVVIKDILAELALTWDTQRHARLDAALLIL